MIKKWARNERRIALARTLEQFWATVGGRPWERKDWPQKRDRRLHQRMYMPRRSGGEGGVARRRLKPGDTLLALERYAGGESLNSIAKDFVDHRVEGLSRTRIEWYADRLVAWWEGRQDTRRATSVDELLTVLSLRRKVRDKLPTQLVPSLRAAAGARSGLPPDLQWQRWTLAELWLFVLTGTWPPRIAWLAAQLKPVARLKAMNTLWVSQTARIARHSCGAVADGRCAADLVAWEQSLSQLRERKLRPDGRGPLKEGATREAVRVALLKGKYPHRWVEDAWSLSSTTPREGTWVPS